MNNLKDYILSQRKKPDFTQTQHLLLGDFDIVLRKGQRITVREVGEDDVLYINDAVLLGLARYLTHEDWAIFVDAMRMMQDLE